MALVRAGQTHRLIPPCARTVLGTQTTTHRPPVRCTHDTRIVHAIVSNGTYGRHVLMQTEIWNASLPSNLSLSRLLLPIISDERLKRIIMLRHRSSLLLRDRQNDLTCRSRLRGSRQDNLFRCNRLCRNDIRHDRSLCSRLIRFQLIVAQLSMRQKSTSLLIAVHIKYPDFPTNSPFGR